MKQLEKQFEGRGQVKGYSFNQITASPYGYIYAVSTKGVVGHYEVFKHLENTLYNTVSYPTNKGFGVWAWTTPDLLKAKVILKSIERSEILKIEVI